MIDLTYPIERDIAFILFEWLQVHRLAELPRCQDLDAANIQGLIAEGLSSMTGDAGPSAYRRVCAAGWSDPCRAKAAGGRGLPRVIATAAAEAAAGESAPLLALVSANRAISHLIERFGPSQVREDYLPALEAGTCVGAMPVSPPDSGGGWPVTAAPLGDGRFEVCGRGRFAGAGLQPAEDRVYCVLGTVEPDGGQPTMFLVPAQNGIAVREVDGDREVTFGQGGATCAFVLGDVHDGWTALSCWRHHARFDDAILATGLASAAYRQALAVARGGDGLEEMRVRVEALRAVVYALSKWSDFEPFELGALAAAGLSADEQDEIRRDTADLIPFLTVMCASWATGVAAEVLRLGAALAGGTDPVLERIGRDLELTTLYERAYRERDAALVRDRLTRDGGRSLTSAMQHYAKLHQELGQIPGVAATADDWWSECRRLEAAGRQLHDPRVEPLMNFFAAVTASYWLLQHSRASALRLRDDQSAQNAQDAVFYRGKLATVDLFIRQVLPGYRVAPAA